MLVFTVSVLVFFACPVLLVLSFGLTPTFARIDALIILMLIQSLFQLGPWPLPHRHSLCLGQLWLPLLGPSPVGPAGFGVNPAATSLSILGHEYFVLFSFQCFQPTGWYVFFLRCVLHLSFYVFSLKSVRMVKLICCMSFYVACMNECENGISLVR